MPLTVRAWRPGDRIRLEAGTRKLKKVFLEHRIVSPERRKFPLLTDETGVRWVVGLVHGVTSVPCEGDGVLSICVRRRE
jgi:tRNA(Ile)-lysidine synthetase-like protein